MPNVKQSPCCARKQARLVMNEANLARLAQQASKRVEKGLDITELKAKIADAKVAIEQDKLQIVEHDAEHAGGLS